MRWKRKGIEKLSTSSILPSSNYDSFSLDGNIVILLSSSFPEFSLWSMHMYIFRIFIPFHVQRPIHNVIFTIGNGRRRRRKFIWKFYTQLKFSLNVLLFLVPFKSNVRLFTLEFCLRFVWHAWLQNVYSP